jgi:hypothetical protein
VPAVHLDQLLADRQAEPGAAGLLRQHVADLVELLEDALVVLGGDADAGVRDRDPQLIVVVPRREADAAARRELGRVRQEVREHLPQAIRVGAQQGQAGLDLDVECQAVPLDELAVSSRGHVDQVGDVDLLDAELYVARLHLGDVEHVVDQPRQPPALAVDDLEELALLLQWRVVAEQQLAVRHHRRQGRA